MSDKFILVGTCISGCYMWQWDHKFILLAYLTIYSKTCLKRNLKGPENFSAEARFPFNQGILYTLL
jgi:hypothetical protein